MPLAARLTQIDYDREMALLAQHHNIALGIARIFSPTRTASAPNTQLPCAATGKAAASVTC